MTKSVTYQEIKESKVKTKFYSELLDKIMTRSEIIKIVTWDWNRISDDDNFNEFVLQSHQDNKPLIPCDLVKLESKSFRRWDKFESRMRLHKGECELSSGPNCTCWCNEKYHGLNYERLHNERVD